MKKTGKAISVILPISLILSSTPNPSALAETTLPTSSESYSFDTFSAVYNTATHILFINGTGELGADSFPTPLPWEEYKDEIRALILSDGVTSITTSIFSDLPGLTNVSLPASIDHIEKDAFLGCPGIQFLAFPGDYNELSKIITENGVTELLAPVAAALEAQLAESSTPAPLPSVTPATTKLVSSDERRISSYHDDDGSGDGSDGNPENEPEESSDSEGSSDPEKTPAPSETTAPPKAPTPTPEVDYTKTDDQGRVTEGRETAEDGSVDKYTVSYDDEDETQTKTGTIKNTDGSVVKYTLYSRADGTPISRSDIVTYPDGGIDSFTTDYNETGIKSGLSGTYKKAGTTDKYTASFTDDGFLSEREGTLTNSDGTDKYTLTYGENESPVKREGALTRSDNTVDKYKVTYKENNTSERTGKIYNGETVIDDYTNTYNGSIISSSSGTRTENGTTNVYSISYDVNGKPSQEHNIFTDTDQSVDDYTITYTNGIISSRSGKKSSGSTVDDYEITYDGSKSVRTGSIATEALPYYEIIKDGETTISEEHYNKDNDDRKTTGWIIEDGEKDNYHYEYTDDSIIRGGERYPISDESNITSYTITTKGDTVTETTFNATSKQGTEIRTVGTVIVEENHYTNTSDGTTGYTITRNNGTVTREEYIIKTEGKTTTRTATQYAGEIKDDKSIKLQYSEVTERNDNNKITKITTTSTTPENEGQTTTTKSFASDGETIQSTCIEWRKDDDNYSIKNYGPEPDSKYLSGESHWKNDEYNWGTTTYGENETYLSGESHWKNDDGNYGEITYGAGGREERGSSHITTSDGVVSDETFSVVYHDDGTYIKNSTTNRTGYSDNTPKTEIYKETKNADGTITTEGHVVETTTIGQKNSDNTSAEHWYSSYTSTTVKNETGGTETTTNSRDLVSLTTTTQIIEKDADGNITKDHTTWEKNNGDNGNYYKNSDGQITNGYQEITTNGVLDKETYQIQYNEDGSSTRTADVTRQVNNDDGSTSTQTEHYTETTKTSSNGTMVVTKNANIWSGEGESKQSLGSYVLIDTTTPDGYHTIDRTDTNAAGMKTQNAETRDSQDNFVSAKRSYTDSEGNIVSTEYDSNWTETDRTWTDVIPEGTRTESYELTKDENNTITGRTGTVTINYEDGHSSTETYTISYTADNGQTRSGLVTTTNADGTKSIDDYYSTANEGGSVTSRTGTITSSTGAVITYTDTYKKHADGSYSTSHRSEEPNGVVFSTSITRNDQTGDSQSVISYIQTTNGYESGYTSYEIYTGSSGTFTKTVVTAVGNGSYYHETDGDENTREECGRDWKPTGWTDPSTNTDNSSTSNTVSPLSLTSPLNTLNPLSLEDSKLLALSPLMGLDGLELKEGQSEEELIGEGLEDGLDEDGNPRYISSDEALPAGEVEETEDSLNGEDENGENIEGNEDELSSTFFFKNAQISTKDQGFIKITKVGDNDVGDELQIVGFTIIPKESDDIKTEDEDAENSTEPSDETFVSDERTIGDNGENNVTEESTTSSDTSTASPTYTPDTTDSSSTTQHSGSVGTSDYSDSYDGDYSDSGDDTYSNPSETTSGTDSDNTDTENVQQPTEPSANEPSAHEKPAEDPQDSEISSETENPPEDQSTPYESPLKDAFVELEPEPVIPPEDEKPDEGDQTEETQTGETEIETGANTETQEIPQENTGNTETGETSSQNTSNSQGYNRGDDDYEYSDGGSENTSNTNDSQQETPGVETVPGDVVSADTTTGDTPDVTIPEIVEPSGDESTANDSETKQDESTPVAGDDENTDVDSSNTDGTTDPNASGESETDTKSADSSESAENGDSGSGDSASGTDSTSDNTADGDNSSIGSTDGSSGYSEPSSGNSESSSHGSSGGSDSSSGSSGGSDSSSGSSGGSDSSSGSSGGSDSSPGSSGGSDSSSGSSGGSDSSSSSSGGSSSSSNESPSAPSAPSEPAQSEPAQSEPAQSEPVQSEPAQSSEPDSSVSDDGRIVIVPSTFDDNTDFGVENVVKVKNAGNFASLLKNVRRAAARFFSRG